MARLLSALCMLAGVLIAGTSNGHSNPVGNVLFVVGLVGLIATIVYHRMKR